MRGRRPEPAAVAAQKAEVRSKRKAPAVVEAVMVGGVAPPKTVKGDALKLWNELAPGLIAIRLLTPLDVPAFARYCRLSARFEEAERMLDAESLVYEKTGAHGTAKLSHPAAMISMRYNRDLVTLEAQFGLLPAERQRIMATRAQTGVTGDLFGESKPAADRDTGARGPAAQPQPTRSPIGRLN